jgi:trimethylamine--corrinoid protein Co-methyltransferase
LWNSKSGDTDGPEENAMETKKGRMDVQQPTLRYLSQAQLERIHNASLEILEKTGMDFYSSEAVDLLAAGGARVVDHKRVEIPATMVENALASAPKTVVLNDRKGRKTLFLEGNNTYYGPGSETPYTLDPYTGKRRPSVKEDVAKAATVVDYLPNIDFVMSFALATDIPREGEDVHHFEAMVLNSTKPILFTSWDTHGIRAIYDMAVAIAGSPRTLRTRPFLCHYIEPISPLKHPEESIDKLLFSVDRGIPVMYVPAPSAGGTAPVTLAGAFALSNAEALGGIILTQLRRKGASVIYGGGPNILDPRTGVFSYGAPEVLISRVVRTELAHFYGLPAFSTGGCTDAKVIDQQAAFEAGNSLMLSSLAGSNFVHDVGYMESGLTSSLELLTMCDDMIGAVKRVLRGFPISDESLALDVIDAVGSAGNFLSLDHTIKHFRKEIWMPQMLDRRNYEDWLAAGSKTLRDRACEKVRWILDNHTPEGLSDPAREQVKEIVNDMDRWRARASS